MWISSSAEHVKSHPLRFLACSLATLGLSLRLASSVLTISRQISDAILIKNLCYKYHFATFMLLCFFYQDLIHLCKVKDKE